MKGFLLDTNIPSEMTRTRPHPSVSAWLDDADDDQVYFSVVSLSESVQHVYETKRLVDCQLLLRPQTVLGRY
jgi:predicted nucleic acid-binding protein